MVLLTMYNVMEVQGKIIRFSGQVYNTIQNKLNVITIMHFTESGQGATALLEATLTTTVVHKVRYTRLYISHGLHQLA